MMRGDFWDDPCELLIAKAGQIYQELGTLSGSVLEEMSAIFGPVLPGALEILDRPKSGSAGSWSRSKSNKKRHKIMDFEGDKDEDEDDGENLAKSVTVIVAQDTKRSIWTVKGSSGLYYHLYPGLNFCRCQSWLFQTWLKSEQKFCKHLLAAKLAVAMNNFEQRIETEKQFTANLVEIAMEVPRLK